MRCSLLDNQFEVDFQNHYYCYGGKTISTWKFAESVHCTDIVYQENSKRKREAFE
jgi:hypothetical protein